MKLLQLILAFALLTPQFIFAQNDSGFNCASDAAMEQFYLTHPEKRAEQNELERRIYENRASQRQAIAPPYTLPIVVHIIHQNGEENIPDAQIELAIDQLNQAFSHTGYYGGNGAGFDTQVQFCLARQDPDGNPSNGITRHVSPLTNMILETEDIAMKDIARWNPLDYINIYVVNDVTSLSAGPGVLGYAFFPTSHGLPEDGIVCESDYFGTSPSENTVFIHEMGHYLNLFHTFQDGCPNDDCLASGDRVCDTPPDQATFTSCTNNSCSTDLDDPSANNPLTVDEEDPTDNYMDYSPFECYHAFTPGQAERIYAAIDLVRFSLLESNGCSSPCPVAISADFTPSDTEIVTGETVTFANGSTGATTYEWSIDGVSFATTENASFTFNEVGTFDVELFIGNGDENCTERFSVTIIVACSVVSAFEVSAMTLGEGVPFDATNTSQNATTYEWYINGVLTSTDTDLFFLFPNGGTYTIRMVAIGIGCINESTETIIVVDNDPCPTQPCPEICDNGFDDDGDGFTDCFDQDCGCYIEVDCPAEPPSNNFGAVVEWRTTNEGPSSLATPLVANLDPQNGGIPEIIVARGDQNSPSLITTTMLFFNGDGTNQATPVELTVQGGMAVRPAPTPTIGDIDGDGIPEVIIVCGDARIRAYTNYDPTANPPMELWATSSTEVVDRRATPSLADFNGDGTPEVLVGNDILQFNLANPASPQLATVLDGDGDYGQVAWFFSNQVTNGLSNPAAADVLSITDCGGNPDCAGIEILAGTHIYSVDLDPFDGDGLEITIQRDLNVLSPGFDFADGLTATADINLDGVLDIVVGSTRDYEEMGMYAWDKNGLLGFFPYPPGNNENFAGMPTIANVYDDTVDGYAQDLPEIICVSANRLTAFNLNALTANPSEPYHWSLFTNESAGFTSPTVFDINGDGRGEICYREDEDFRIIYGGPEPLPAGINPLDRNWFSLPCFSPTGSESTIVADCDGDGEAEIVYTGKTTSDNVLGNTRSHLWVVGSEDLPWTSCRPVWNQYAYFGVNVNDNLLIPADQQTHQLEFPGLGSGNRPFNQYRAQLPVLDENFTPFYPVPDATVVVDSSQCEGENIRTWVTVCNEGNRDLPSNTPIIFYDGDPIITAAPRLFGPLVVGTLLLPGECINLELVIPTVDNTPIHVVVNVDLSLTPPFDPVTDFPVNDILECDYSNNSTSFIGPSSVTTPLDLGPDIVLCGSSVVSLDAGESYDSYEWQDGSEEQTFTAFLPGRYWVTVQSECGVPLSDTIEVTLNDLATFDLGPTRSICAGDPTELTVTGFDEVSWSPIEGLSCINCTTTTASPTENITYYATGRNGDCLFTDSIRIIIEEIELELTTDTLSCSTPVGQINATANITDLNFSWSGPGGFTSTQATTMVTLPGDYTVTAANNAGGCEAIETITVTIDATIQIELETVTDTLNCSEPIGQISVAANIANLTYSWTGPGGFTSDQATATVTLAGEYTVTASNSTGGCETIETLTVIADELLPIAQITTPDTTLGCDILTFLIDATTSSQGSDFIYAWSPISGILSGANTLTPQINQAGTYLLTVTNQTNGCSATDQIVISTPTIPTITDFTTSASGCNGEPIGSIEILQITGGNPAYEYSLDGQAFTPNPIFSNLPPGIYSIQVSDENGCQSTIIAEVPQSAPLFVTLTGDTVVTLNQLVQVTAVTTPPNTPLSTIFWQPSGLEPELAISTIITEETLFTITVTDTAGCTASDDLLVRLAGPPNRIYFPNVINLSSPNGENFGFTGFGGEQATLIRNLRIFDRWGGFVYKGENLPPNRASVGWDGTARGRPVEKGVYLYFAEVEFSDGEVLQLSGDVMVIR